jgi:hypothetical protein
MLRTSMVVLGAGIVIVGGLTLFKQPDIVYERLEPEKEVVVETVVEKELDSRIKTAQEAKLAEVEAAAKKAYDAAYTQAMDEIKLEVITEYRKEVQQMETELSKSVGAF